MQPFAIIPSPCCLSEFKETYQQRKQQIVRGVSKKPLSAHGAAWLFVCNPRKLKWRQVWWQLEPLRTEDEELGRAYHVVQDFRTMIVQRQASVLEASELRTR